MMDPAECPSCGHSFDAPPELAGAITNCPRCGKAVEVPGLRDPLWRLWQAGLLVLAAVVAGLVGVQYGVLLGIGVGAALAVLLWLISRAF